MLAWCGLALLLQALCLAAAGRHDIYKGYSAHGIKVLSPSHAALVNSLSQSLELDEWRAAVVGHRDAVVMVTADRRAELMAALDKEGLEHYVAVEDVAEMFEKQDSEKAAWRASRQGPRLAFADYPRHDEMNEYIEYLAATYPDLATLEILGPSFEGREIKYLKISTSNFTDESKPIFFMNAGIHSREWVVGPVALYTLHKLLEDRDAGDQDLIEDMDWIIIPCTNPDGYEFTHTDDRMWRRTRSINPNLDTDCRGVDGNRNFDYNFGEYGVTWNPCTDTYPGEAPFSDLETSYIRDLVLEHVHRIEIYIDVHSYGNLILYGYDDYLAPNTVELHHVGATMGAVIDTYKLPESYYYLVGNAGILLYPAAGNAQDWAQSVGVRFSYTLELPDMGGWWFEVPPQYIDQINMETWHGIAATARLVKKYHDASN